MDTFDPDVWLANHLHIASTLDFSRGRYVYGPANACAREQLRKMANNVVNEGPGVPCDMFLLSLGEPNDRFVTKVGGLPYYRSNRQWPLDSEGRKIPFLAQFVFSDSRDIVDGIKSDVLLIFSHVNPWLGCTLRWESTVYDDAELVTSQSVPISTETTEVFWGTRWRTCNFPDWENKLDKFDSSWIRLENGSVIQDAYYIYEMLGMQIGESGFLPPGLQLEKKEKIICSLGGICFAPEQPSPLLNVSKPFEKEQRKRLNIPLSDINDVDGFGVIFVVKDVEGKYKCVLKNL